MPVIDWNVFNGSFASIDKRDLSEYDPFWLHQQIGMVEQIPSLFATSIANNIAYGLKNVSRKEIERAAIEANAHDFINTFVDGYETMVGERGVRLSGGQKQRIAIARALLKSNSIPYFFPLTVLIFFYF